MNEQELAKALPTAHHVTDTEAGNLFEDRISVFEYSASARYYLTGSEPGQGEKLDQIMIVFDAPPKPDQFLRLKKIFVGKYGNPIYDGETEAADCAIKNARNPGQCPPARELLPSVWRFVGDTIELSCGGTCTGDKDQIAIVFMDTRNVSGTIQ